MEVRLGPKKEAPREARTPLSGEGDEIHRLKLPELNWTPLYQSRKAPATPESEFFDKVIRHTQRYFFFEKQVQELHARAHTEGLTGFLPREKDVKASVPTTAVAKASIPPTSSKFNSTILGPNNVVNSIRRASRASVTSNATSNRPKMMGVSKLNGDDDASSAGSSDSTDDRYELYLHARYLNEVIGEYNLKNLGPVKKNLENGFEPKTWARIYEKHFNQKAQRHRSGYTEKPVTPKRSEED
jgi:hypothetical protein